MNKSKNLIIIFVIVAGIFLLVGQKYYQGKINAQTSSIKSTNVNSEVPTQTIYDKLKNQEPIHYLVVGDSIGASTGASSGNSWETKFNKLIEKKYGSPAFGDQLTKGGSDVFDGLVEYDQSNLNNSYDMIFVVFGANDRHSLSVNQYNIFYKTLLTKLSQKYPKAEIFPVIESCMRASNVYPDALKSLASQFGLTTIDTREAYQKSGINYDQLTVDGTHPNDKGYDLYVQQFADTVDANLKANKKISYSKIQNEASVYQNLKIITNSKMANGFSNGNNGATLNVNFSGSVLGVSVGTDVDGGLCDIYVGGQLIKTIDTYNSWKVTRHLLVADNLSSGNHTVKFVVKGESDSKSKGTMVRISDIITD